MTEAGGHSELEGAWVAQEAKIAGEEAPQVVGQHLSFLGSRFNVTKDGGLLYGGAFAVDPAATQPTIDFDQNETTAFAGVWRGIYTLAGDQLTICDNSPDMTKPRPRTFVDGAAAGYIVVRFRRDG